MYMRGVIIVLVDFCRSFVSNITAIPTQIMAVSEAEGASALYLNELTQSLLMEGRAIADRLEASFHPVNSNLHQQSTYILHTTYHLVPAMSVYSDNGTKTHAQCAEI